MTWLGPPSAAGSGSKDDAETTGSPRDMLPPTPGPTDGDKRKAVSGESAPKNGAENCRRGTTHSRRDRYEATSRLLDRGELTGRSGECHLAENHAHHRDLLAKPEIGRYRPPRGAATEFTRGLSPFPQFRVIHSPCHRPAHA